MNDRRRCWGRGRSGADLWGGACAWRSLLANSTQEAPYPFQDGWRCKEDYANQHHKRGKAAQAAQRARETNQRLWQLIVNAPPMMEWEHTRTLIVRFRVRRSGKARR